MTGEPKPELKELFDKVVSLVQSSPSDEHLSDDIKLQLYGLYKRCTVGRAANSDSSEPSLWNIVAYRKYGAWKKVDNLDLEQAMQRYIRVVSMLDNSTGVQCRDLFKEESLSEMVVNESVGERPHDGATPEHGKHNIEKKCTLDQPAKILTVGPVKPCMFQRLTGIQPFVPRGELDITFTDIAYALFRCIKLPSPFFEAPMRATLRLEDEIAQTWNSNTTMNLEVIPGLSVRSLVDLYLSAKSYPKGSELIIVPPIGIEGMMDVIQYHGLNIIPVDIGDYSDDPVLHVDIDKVKQAMNEKTVAVLVVHAFGLICVNEEEMKELRNVVDNHSSAKDVEIWEDCAECFEGQGGYMGSEYANVHFFSFGTIKTCTALGGGICALNSQLDKGAKATVEHMKRIQHMMNGQQTGKEYFVKIVKASVLLLFGKNPMLMGVVIWILDILGINYDNIVTSAVKGFPCVPPKAGSSEFDLNEHKRIRAIQLVQRLRKCPHPALLSLLHRRLKSKRTSITVMKRMERSAKMKQLFKEYLPSIQIPTGGQGSKHLFWLFPIITSDADKVYQKMKRYGFDIPRGTSQLGCVTKYLMNSEKHLDSCPNTLRMMSEISYLPVASRDMSETEMRKLVSFFYTDHQYIDDIDKKDSLSAMLPFTTLGMLMATLIIFDLYHFQVVFSLTLIATYIARTWQLFVGVFAVLFAVAICLRTALATEYINSSKTFARYNSILSSSPKKQNDLVEIMTRKSGASIVDGSDIHAQTYDLDNHSALMLPQEYDHGECNDEKQVLLAGATGFIGSLLLRDLLMHRAQTSIKGGVAIICRSKRGQSAKQRMQSLLSKEMFSFLSEDQKEKLVTVIEGDLSLPKMGLSEPEYNSLCDELNVTHVINCAACVNFMEPLAKAAESNITSALQLQLLSKSMKRNKVNYIYISTAFVHGDKTGSAASPLPPKLFDLQKYDPLDLYESMMNTESCASAAMNDLGFPNTYTFTKSICEHLLMRDQSIRTTIIRPCIVGPAVQNPCEGWAGDKPSTLTAGACLYLSSPANIWSFKRERAAVIPVDVVSRFILAKAFETHAEDLTTATSDENNSGLSSFDSSNSGQESDHSSEQSYVFAKSSALERKNVKPKDHHRSNECVQGPTGQSQIYNATWDASSPESTTFEWYSFACAILQLGSAKNHADKFTTYMVFLVSFKIFLAMDLTFNQFRKVHRNLVHLPLSCLQRVWKRFGLRPRSLRNLEKLIPFIDLPVLFFPFTSSTFHFESDLVAPVTFNGERYMFSSVLAAEQFILSLRQRKQSQQGAHEEIVMNSDRTIIAGKNCPSPYSDLLWCMMQPRGNIVIRFVGWIVIKLLRAVTSEVTLDTGSFSSITRAVTEIQHSVRNQEESLQNKTFIILAPTHRSFLDFIILSFIAFQVPELGIPIPSIAAADEFSRIPIIGFMTRLAGAFFLERGKGVADPALQAKVHSLKLKHCENNPTCIEVFLEGSRSRDRRFVKPKTGFLRCLVNTHGNHVIVPIAINYESLPEQSRLANEADGSTKTQLCILRLFNWFKAVRSRSVNLGRIHISAAQPVLMKEGSGLDVKKVAETVQTLQRTKIMVSKIHVSACASVLDIDEATVYRSVQKLNCDIWYEDTVPGSASLLCPLSLPTSATERWTLFLHFGHFYAKYLEESHPIWAGWLAGGSQVCHESSLPIDESTRVVVKSLQQLFESADTVIETTKRMLQSKGFERPAHSHILQYAWNNGCDLPRFLLQAALSIAPDTISLPGQDKIQRSIHIPVDPLFNTRNVTANDQLSSSESFGAWGYKDSGFILNVNKNGSKSVTMKGDRYKISGRPMPKLVPFLESETKSYVDPVNVILPKVPTIAIPRTDLSNAAIKKLRGAVGNDAKRLSITDIDRARHGTGHSQEDIFMIRTGTLSQIRLPDAVICPEEESEIEQIVLLAKAENWCLIPFGGGTNVCHATWCPPKEKDPRFMISVDMRLMNKILSVNEEDSTIHVQAGITGGDLVREMMSRGYTIGHEPDSIEFSTLGGWIATKASGMKQNRYGNIEGIVKEVRVMTSKGKLWQHNSTDSASYARVSTGTDLTALMLGSEGSLGIITSAVMKIWPLPKVKEYESVILHKFDDGIRFMKEVSKLGALKPASVRLLDNTQFRLGQAMKSNDSFLEGIKKSYKKFVAGLFTDSFDPNEMVCATITLEGSEAEVKLQTEQISKAAKTHGGLCAGSDIGRAGYDMTYAIAYIRDFAMTYGFLAESFETFVPWSKVKTMITATKNRLKKEHEERALPGCPIITCRITQLYDEGVCVYFYFCMNFKNVENPSTIFAEIEMAARNEIMANGGSLSHHHGVGKHRAPLMDRVNSKNLQDVFFSLKDSIDPDNIFGVRNGTYASF